MGCQVVPAPNVHLLNLFFIFGPFYGIILLIEYTNTWLVIYYIICEGNAGDAVKHGNFCRLHNVSIQ